MSSKSVVMAANGFCILVSLLTQLSLPPLRPLLLSLWPCLSKDARSRLRCSSSQRVKYVDSMRPVDVAFSARRRQALLSVAVCLSPAAPPVLGGAWPALAAAELTDEQSLIVEAWAVVQRGYVDQQFGGRDWKATKSEYLKRKYRNAGEAREAVSEMVALLGDRYTRYLSPGAYAALLAKYERPADNGGIGVTVRNVPMSLSTPTPGAGRGPVEIVSVVDGGPADIAGLRVGDIFETIDNRPLPAYATADDAAGLLLGRLDEPLSVGVRRADGSSASFTTKRAVLKQGEVEASVAERSAGKRIGVLKVPLFSAPVASGGGGGTLASMQAALAAEPLASAPELLIDLRGNARHPDLNQRPVETL